MTKYLLGAVLFISVLVLSFEEKEFVPASFTHGIASGDPYQESVLLWTRLVREDSADAQVQWEIANDTAFSQIVNKGKGGAKRENDYTVKVIAAGLQPGQEYYYRFMYEDITSPIGRTQTLPVQNRSGKTRSCQLCKIYGRVFSCIRRTF